MNRAYVRGNKKKKTRYRVLKVKKKKNTLQSILNSILNSNNYIVWKMIMLMWKK